MSKTRTQRTREGRWTHTMDDYRRRHRTWVMQCMPIMSDHEWKMYEAWVAGFGAMRLDQAARNSRKTRRQLRAARDKPVVTGPVTNNPKAALMATKNTRMRFAMGLVPVAGAAKPGRATRQT